MSIDLDIRLRSVERHLRRKHGEPRVLSAGEFMVLLSAFKASPVITMVAALTLVIGAAYTLWMVKRVFYGAVVSDQVAKLQDVSGVDWCVFVLLAVMLLGLGVYPNVLLDVMHSSVGHTLHLALSSKLT